MINYKTIAITNQKGGVGKATTTLNLGVTLASKGCRVLLVDADPQGNLTTSLGIKDLDSLTESLTSVMQAQIYKPSSPGESLYSPSQRRRSFFACK